MNASNASKFTVYGVRQRNSDRVGRRFAMGSGLTYRILNRDDPNSALSPGGVVMYGDAYGLRKLLDDAIATNRKWFYIDNGYFKPGHFSGFYRVTRGAYACSGDPSVGVDARAISRWKALRLEIKPWSNWQGGSGFVLVCPPGESYGKWRGLNLSNWLDETLAILRANTDREIRIRPKPAPHLRRYDTIQMALHGAHALVTYASNTASEALLEGVPVFCNGPENECPTYHMCERDFTKIETPVYPENRQQWAAKLAANQWSMGEIMSGQCWKELMGTGAGRI